MTFSQLHERLRIEMWRRIQRGVVTGKLLAAQTGLRPSHISNFLHRKRKLSLPALDRLLAAQQITVHELLGAVPGAEGETGADRGEALRIPLVSQTAIVTLPQIPVRAVRAYLTFPAGDLDRFPARPAAGRRAWQRFIALRVSDDQARSMEPSLGQLSIVVIDRHYNSLVPVAPPRPNLYALRLGNKLLLRYVTFDSNRLLLRPACLDSPVDAIELASHDSPSDLLVGRVCLCVNES